MYYAFTSLTTVGFGDYHPKSDYERVFISILLLFAVIMFSYNMTTFIEILHSIQVMYEHPFEADDDLAKFFGLLRQFNKGNSINDSLKMKFEKYFQYKWNSDLNLAMASKEDKKKIENLP